MVHQQFQRVPGLNGEKAGLTDHNIATIVRVYLKHTFLRKDSVGITRVFRVLVFWSWVLV